MNAKILTTEAVLLFLDSSALMFLDKNATMFHDKSAEVFPAKIAKTLHDRCQGRSVNLFLLSPAVSTLSRSVPTSPNKCASVCLTSSARMCPSRSAVRCQDSSASRSQDKCVQQLSQYMANNSSLIQPGY